ncbi:neutral zinc metallopeptidase [Kribbella capetownensis]|nr:neutral zinc metallopeptidase [Kribbella capetownensis]
MPNQPPYGPPPQQPGPYQGPPPPQYGPPPGPPPQYWGPPQGPPRMGPPMGPPPGPGFGWGSNGFPPPKKKSKAGWIVLPIAIVGLAIVGFAVLSGMLKHNSDDYTQPEPTSSTYEPTEGPTYIPTTKVPTAPATRTTQPQPTKTTPPPPSDSDIVTKNRFYRTGVQNTVNCKESKSRANSMANARKYYTSVLNCLIRAWPKQVNAGGAHFVAPHLIAFTGSVSTPCSGNAPSSFYCRSNRTIYMDAGSDVTWYRGHSNDSVATTWLRADMTDTVAHEFGHHIQAMTGILAAESNLEYELSGDKSLEMSRRTEIQATCFGNVFMGANKSSYRLTGSLKKELDFLHSHQGDEYGTVRDHGSRTVIPRWAKAGFTTRSPGSCNTYLAAAKYVK